MKIFFFHFSYFWQLFGIFDIYLLQKNQGHQHLIDDVSTFFRFSLFLLGCLKTALSFISIGLVFLDIWMGCQIDLRSRKNCLQNVQPC